MRVAPIERVIEGLLKPLPTVSTIAAVATTTISAASATATTAVSAATTTTAAVSTASAAITAATAAASTTATTTFGLRSRFVHHQVSSAKILTVQRIDRALRIFVTVYLNECKTARLARETIPNEIDTRGTDTDLREILCNLFIRRGKRKIANVELLHLPAPSARNPVASRGAR
jgi:hypothetical protein